MRLLLVHPRFPYHGKDLFPIGLGYIASVARDKAEIFVVDENVEKLDAEKIKSINPDMVGISATTPSFPRAAEIISKIKTINPDAVVILGGVHATFAPEEALAAGADIVVRGEGEKSFNDIINGVELKKIAGISYKRDGIVTHSPAQELIRNLDEIPFPAWEFFPCNKYGIMSITTSRGCTYSCSYCSATRFWRQRIRMRSARNVVEELKQISKLGFRLVRFMDSTFTIDKKRAIEICELIKSSNLNLRWSCETRCDYLDDELLGALRSAGCILLCLGVDSASQEVLDKNNRKIEVAAMKHAFEKIRQHAIATRAYVTFGFPGESERSVAETLRFLDEVKPDQILLSLATAYPGTELARGPFIDLPPEWIAKFHGHGLGAKLYFPEGMSRREYIRLAELMWREVKRMNKERARRMEI